MGFSRRTQLSMDFTEEVVSHLFPVHKPVHFLQQSDVNFQPFTDEELQLAWGRLKSRKAPGPGKILPEILKKAAQERPRYLLSVNNRLAVNGSFPKKWKESLLVLLQKAGKPLDSPSSQRPICLLDAEGKLYEQLILQRLKKELERTGNLSDQQYGFREGRQTVDAIKAVIQKAEEAGAYSSACRRLCAVITLDVKNAFNSASWQIILDELRERHIDESLINIIASYFAERTIVLEAEGRGGCLM